MHPSDLELIQFARKPAAERDLRDPIAAHVAGCGLCRDEISLMEEWLAEQSNQDSGTPSRSPFEEAVLRLLRRPVSVIPLTILDLPHRTGFGHSLAADGVALPQAGLQHRATLYSEMPEVILRIMHDPATQRDVLQLTADDPTLSRHVFIRYGDPAVDVLTNERGIAEVPATSINDPMALTWRVQLPDASFTLKALDAPRLPDETVIDLPDGDRIAVAALSDSAGLSLRVRPIRIHGREQIGRFRAVVCQPGGRWQVVDTPPSGECVAANLSSDDPIEIRLYVIE